MKSAEKIGNTVVVPTATDVVAIFMANGYLNPMFAERSRDKMVQILMSWRKDIEAAQREKCSKKHQCLLSLPESEEDTGG